MLVCRAPTYPPKTGPTPKDHCLSENLYFLFSFSLILLTNSLKSVKAVFLIEERLHRLLLYAFLPYTASISSCVLGAQKNPLIEMVLLSTQNTCFGPETKKMRENLSSKFPKRVSSATVTSENLNIFKTSPFLELCAKSLYPYICVSALAHLSLICCNCVILCVVRCGERVGERRGSISGFNW